MKFRKNCDLTLADEGDERKLQGTIPVKCLARMTAKDLPPTDRRSTVSPQAQFTPTNQSDSTLDAVHRQGLTKLDAIRDPIFVIDSTGNVIRANGSFSMLAGSAFVDFLGHSVDCLLPWLSAAMNTDRDETAASPDGRVFRVRTSQNEECLEGQMVILEDVSIQTAVDRPGDPRQAQR